MLVPAHMIPETMNLQLFLGKFIAEWYTIPRRRSADKFTPLLSERTKSLSYKCLI